MSTADFDVLAYSREAQGSFRTQLSGVGEPMTDDLRDLLVFLRDRITGTTTWMSLVLVTPTHKDARATAFLSAWAYERHWMGDALGVLAGAEPLAAHAATTRDRLAPLREAVVANLHGAALTAVHMAERFVDGEVLDRLLARAVALAPDGVAADLGRVRGILARQQRFFREEAEHRLAASASAQRLSRTRLSARAWPIGAEQDAAGTARAFALLDRGDPGWAAGVDARVDELPGLAGLRLLERSAANPGTPVLRTPLRSAAVLGRLAAALTNRKG